MLHSAASDLGLHCLPVTLLGVSRLQWVNPSSANAANNFFIYLFILFYFIFFYFIFFFFFVFLEKIKHFVCLEDAWYEMPKFYFLWQIVNKKKKEIRMSSATVFLIGLTFITHSMGKFSRQQIDDIFSYFLIFLIFLIFIRKQDLIFCANCLLWRQFAQNVKTCFLGKNKKKYVCMLSAEN